MKKFIIYIFLLLLLGCNNDKSDCADTFCTENFLTITVSIKDTNAIPIALDRFEVLVIESGVDITRIVNDSEIEIMKQNGTYPLFGDEYQQSYANTQVQINFKGIINNQIIVNEDFTVGADCCHVNLISGNTNIVTD
jgi:hypothetical protein